MPSDQEHFQRINKAVNYINENPSENLSLDELARLSNYSPFHFQKLFKSIVGETPKQYLQRVRLETAAHALVMFRHKSVTEIALDSGFSSSATFARAFKNYFGISAQELRNTSEAERLKLLTEGNRLLAGDHYFLNQKFLNLSASENYPSVTVEKGAARRGIFVNASLDSEAEIDRAFRKVAQLAGVNDLMTSETKFIGVIHAHQKLYQAMATVEPSQEIAKGLSLKEIEAGKYAVIKISGGIKEPFDTMQTFVKIWLPQSGYQIAEIFSFEVFRTPPFLKPYRQTERDLYIPIEAAR